MRRLPAALVSLAAVLALAGCGRVHTLQEGLYDLHLDEAIRDDCGLLDVDPSLGSASLSISGDFVQMRYSRYQTELAGEYLLREEEFTADGSAANVTAVARGDQCLVDLITVHFDAKTDCKVQYSGTLRITYQTPTDSACACQLWVRYHAIARGEDPAADACPNPSAP